MTIELKTRLYSRIANNSDDAFQTGTTVDISQTAEHKHTNDLIGLRFLAIGVPRGATITRAVLRYTVGPSGNPNLQIHCQDSDNPATFTTSSDNIGGRPLTTAATSYQTSGLSGTAYSPDFSGAVQEVVDRAGWAPGNALAVILKSNADTTFSIQTIDNNAYGRATLIIEYTMPQPIAPAIHSITTASATNTTTKSLSVSIPTAGGTRLYVFVHSTRGSGDYNTNIHAVSSATLDGRSMTLIDTQAGHIVLSHYNVLALYEVIDPLDNGGNPASQTLAVTMDKSVQALGITAVVVTGVTERGDATKTDSAGIVSDIALDVETDRFPGLILAAGQTKYKGTSLDYLYATDDAGAVAQYRTGTSAYDFNLFLGGANATEPGTYRLGWSWGSVEWSSGGANAQLMAVPLYGRVEAAEAEFSALDPAVIYGSATLDGLSAAAEFGAVDPAVVLGSIPPVQVSGRGALFLSTSSRLLTVCLLATNGDDWVITDGGGNVEQLSLRINRRSGYLTPV